MALQRCARISDGKLGYVDSYGVPNSIRDLLLDKMLRLEGLSQTDRIVVFDSGDRETMSNAYFQANYTINP
jgi:hypothetical protein